MTRTEAIETAHIVNTLANRKLIKVYGFAFITGMFLRKAIDLYAKYAILKDQADVLRCVANKLEDA